MRDDTIIIDKMVVDVFLDSHPEPAHFLQQTTAEIQEWALPFIEQRLAELGLDAGGKSVLIDHLELDLESEPNWQESLGELVAREIEGAWREVETSEKREEEASRLGEKTVSGELLWTLMERFLEAGRFSVSPNGMGGLKLREVENAWLKSSERAMLFERLAVLLEKNPVALKRFWFQSSFVKEPVAPEVPITFLKQVRLLKEKTTIAQIMPVERLIEEKCGPELQNFLAILRAHKPVWSRLEPVLERFLTRPEVEKIGLADWTKEFSAFMEEPEEIRVLLADLKKRSLDEVVPALVQLIWLLEEQQEKRSKEKTRAKPMEVPKSKPVSPTVMELIFQENAGIVLLNPFLPILFRNLELLDEKNKWLSETEQVKAIYLIHYLGTGELDATEDQLFLAKLLTGYDLEAVLPPAETVLDQEKWELRLAPELDELLNAVHDNWRPMRNCTWAGLRNDFLTRAGTLRLRDEQQYELTVEPGALDVMLPFKKWGLSPVKYSWMERVLNVEWRVDQ